MKELARTGETFMTVKAIAEVLGTAESTIRNKARELFPESIENGKVSLFTEEEVSAIKNAIVPRDLTLKSKLDSAVTSIDIERMTLQVIQYHVGKVNQLEAELAAAAPKVESFNALMRSEYTMSITEAAKHFGLHPKAEVFPYLRDRGYLTARDLPTQAALDAGYLAVREAHCLDGEVRKQAVVLTSQLETWRTRVIPQIAHWKATA